MKKYLLTAAVLLPSTLNAYSQSYNEGSNGNDAITEWVMRAVCFLIGCIVTVALQVVFGQKSKRKYSHHQDRTKPSKITQIVRPDDFVESSKKTIPSEKLTEQSSGMFGYVPPAAHKVKEFNQEEMPVIVEFPVINNLPPVTSPTLASVPQVLYFPNPGSGGVFRKVDGRDNFIDGASIYKFTLIAADRAEFEFCTERSSVSIALNNRNELIMSVAEELNPYDSHAAKLLSAPGEFGAAKLEGNNWIVTKKAKIRYQ